MHIGYWKFYGLIYILVFLAAITEFLIPIRPISKQIDFYDCDDSPILDRNFVFRGGGALL